MLRPSKLNPLVSSYTTVRGHYDFMKSPIAPAGCKVLVHDRPMERGSWSDRGTEGFFLNQAPQHYRNFICYMPKTNSTRTSNTVEFFPSNCSLPKLEPLDTVSFILTQLRETLIDPPKNNLFTGPHHDLLAALNSIQGLLGLPTPQIDDKQPAEAPTSKGASSTSGTSSTYKGGPQLLPIRTKGPTTRSQQPNRMHPNGTIVRKAFNKGHYEGEITNHDPMEDFYRIRYSDGDTEEMTFMEVQQYKKPLQQYSPKHQAERHKLANTIRTKLHRDLCQLQAKRL